MALVNINNTKWRDGMKQRQQQQFPLLLYAICEGRLLSSCVHFVLGSAGMQEVDMHSKRSCKKTKTVDGGVVNGCDVVMMMQKNF